MIRPILPWPHPALSERSLEIVAWNEHLATLVGDLLVTAKSIPHCLGLAAPQIGSPVRVFCLAPQVTDGEWMVLVNPALVTRSIAFQVYEEGCLSLPGITLRMQRSAGITVEARKPNGDPLQFDATGLMAQAIQHEINHLDGRCIADGCNRVKRKWLAQKQARYGGQRGQLLQYDTLATP